MATSPSRNSRGELGLFWQTLRVSRGAVCLFILLSLAGCEKQSIPVTVCPYEYFFSSALELGCPTDTDASDDVIIRHFQYTTSYNPTLNVPNWVCWNEDSAWYGPVDRCDCFDNDPLLPSYLPRLSSSTYSGSGYDRGHLANSEARTRCDSDNKATFYYSNIIPQTPSLNRQTWYSLEKFCDSLCTKANKELYVMAGGIYHTKKRIANLVTIPDSCWKVVVVLNRSQKVCSIDTTARVIAVIMKNGDYTKETNDWRQYTTTVADVEAKSGYQLLCAVPDAIRQKLRTKKEGSS